MVCRHLKTIKVLFFLVDDQLKLEVFVGIRPWLSDEAATFGIRTTMGQDAVNVKKKLSIL